MAKTKAATKGGSKRQKPPPLDQYKKPLIGVALAMLAYQVFKGMVAKEILRVDMTATANELELREVFFGEDPSTGSNTNYAVLCYPEGAIYPISSVFQDAANDGTAPAQFRIMDCDVPMPGSEEGKTVIGRFKLSKKTRPVVFVSGSVGEPKHVRALCVVRVWQRACGFPMIRVPCPTTKTGGYDDGVFVCFVLFCSSARV